VSGLQRRTALVRESLEIGTMRIDRRECNRVVVIPVAPSTRPNRSATGR
jgi:hypothetical protein